MNKKFRSEITELIKANRISEAIELFKSWASEHNQQELIGSLTQLQARYNKVKRRERVGIIQLSEALKEDAFVIDAILDFMNEQPDVEERKTPDVPSPPSASKKTILFLASMPSDEARLQLNKEFRMIFTNLQNRTDQYELKAEWAVKPSDLQRAILRHRPHIIHFSGHGTSGNADKPSGLLFENREGKAQLIATNALENMFKIFSKKVDIQVVVLNACFSELQAEPIRQHVPFVVGMKDAINDDTALEFSSGFSRRRR